jgi:prolyl 4-hydroxylase
VQPEPRMALVHGFLSPSECTHLIGRARDLLAPSVVARIEGGVENKRVSGSRTSSSCCLAAKDDMVVRRAVQRAAYLAGLSPQHSEQVQVVHYKLTEQYRPHYDFFGHEQHPGLADEERLEDARGNRLLSFFVYLQLPKQGGRTHFPQLEESFQPTAGGGARGPAENRPLFLLPDRRRAQGARAHRPSSLLVCSARVV